MNTKKIEIYSGCLLFLGECNRLKDIGKGYFEYIKKIYLECFKEKFPAKVSVELVRIKIAYYFLVEMGFNKFKMAIPDKILKNYKASQLLDIDKFSSGFRTLLRCSQGIKNQREEVKDGRGNVGGFVRRRGSPTDGFESDGNTITQTEKGEREMTKKRMVIKSKAKKQSPAKKGKFKSVSELVRTKLSSNINYPTTKLAAEVKALQPKSKWNSKHDAWYRSAMRNGRPKKVR